LERKRDDAIRGNLADGLREAVNGRDNARRVGAAMKKVRDCFTPTIFPAAVSDRAVQHKVFVTR
jgi:hypothetical protein